jgi:hypothetical protein
MIYKTDDYYLAPCLVGLFHEVDARWPNRSRASDGWIGDASHAARASEHNPDYSAGGVVRAIDVTSSGIDVEEVLNALIGDDRVWYVIWNRRIASRAHGWVWQAYNGASAHTEHVHVSIRKIPWAEADPTPWFPKEDNDVITDADIEKIADAVLRKVEPRLKAYAADVKLYEKQTDAADARRAADAVAAKLAAQDKP